MFVLLKVVFVDFPFQERNDFETLFRNLCKMVGRLSLDLSNHRFTWYGPFGEKSEVR